jgi:hypothetical protein
MSFTPADAGSRIFRNYFSLIKRFLAIFSIPIAIPIAIPIPIYRGIGVRVGIGIDFLLLNGVRLESPGAPREY